MEGSSEITELLLAWEQGDQGALERLMPLVMEELRRYATRYMRDEKQGHLLQTTALINEAYIKLIDQKRVHWRNRQHFYAIAATCMRRVLCDYARAETAEKRGGRADHIPISDIQPITFEKATELLILDEALNKLAKQDERKSQIVELRYYGGFSVKEVAKIMGLSERTIYNEWEMASAWLKREMMSIE